MIRPNGNEQTIGRRGDAPPGPDRELRGGAGGRLHGR